MKEKPPANFEFDAVSGGETGNTTIVVAARPTPAAKLAAIELRYHLARITGRLLPIRADDERVTGKLILVGESEFTRREELRSADFESQEYLIRVAAAQIVLMGRDEANPGESRAESGLDTNYTRLDATRVTVGYEQAAGEPLPSGLEVGEIDLPGPYDEQGTCCAVYDFLERFCDVRWFGPGASQMTHPRRTKFTFAGGEIRRSPAMKFRMGTPTWDWPIMKGQWGNPGTEAVALYFRRLRLGGEKWAANHSFRSYQDRFWAKNAAAAELLVERRAEYFAQGQAGGSDSRQLCYTNAGLIRQVAQDARDYFDGKGLKGQQVALGDYFALAPLDNASWCQCAACQALLAKDVGHARGGHFNSGTASTYWFTFVNAVAREIAPTHAGKYVATLAYHVYAFRPRGLTIEPNVAVAPCLQVRNYWAPRIAEHEHEILRQWTEPRDRPVHVWNYYCFPEEPGFLTGTWKCFPGFSARRLAEEIQRYHRAGVRGVFLCGLGEQLDFYVTMKLYDDPGLDVDGLLQDFFARYFGSAAIPMRDFYRVIEQTYSDPRNYPAELVASENQLHQTEEIAWKYLGTGERMAELGRLIGQAERQAGTEEEKRRVRRWKVAVWEHMLEGRRRWLERSETPETR